MKTISSIQIDIETQWRGGQRQVELLCKGLLDQGHPVLLVTHPDSPLMQKAKDAGIEVFDLRPGFEFDPFAIRRLAALIKDRRPDIVGMHASHSHTLGVLAKRFASTDAKYVVTRRVDFAPGQDPINRWKYQKGPDAYIAISQAIRNILVGSGIEKDRVHLAHSGVLPLDIPTTSRKDWQKKLEADDDAILIGNVAGLVDHKGQTFLLSAIPQIIEQIPNALFVIAGDGELRQKLETQATALGLTDRNLRFLGHQTAIASLYGAFDIFAMTSHLEGLCTSIIDAQLAQVPVVATDAGGIGELVIHEKTGLLAKSRSPESIAENLIRLCKDPALQKQLAKTAKKTAAAGFTAHAMVQSTLKAYIKILGL